jgi:hypothetical protein
MGVVTTMATWLNSDIHGTQPWLHMNQRMAYLLGDLMACMSWQILINRHMQVRG